MKAKSKVLLGLLVALAMMVMAVPAFAADFTVTPSTPKTVYQSENATATDPTFTLTISGTQDETFTITNNDIVDTTANLSETEKVTIGELALNPTDRKGPTVVVSVPVSASASTKVGAHTLTYKVSNGSLEQTGTVTVTVAALPTAKLTGYDAVQSGTVEQATKALKVGDSIDTHVVEAPEGATLQWQMSKTTTNSTDDKDWENIPGEEAKSDTLDKTADISMNNKFIRCAVTTADGKTVYAAIDDNKVTDNKTTIQLNVSDEKAITVNVFEDQAKTKAAKSSYEFYAGTAAPLTLFAQAAGGPTADDYVWTVKKDGKVLTPAELQDLKITVNATKPSIAFTDIPEKAAGKYQAVATKGTGTTAVSGESTEITIAVKKTPTLTVQEADVTQVAKYTNPATTPDKGEGAIYVTEEQAKQGVTLTAKPDGAEGKVYTWFKNSIETEPFDTATSVDIPAADVVEGAKYIVKVGFGDTALTQPLVFETTIHIVSGELSGGLLKSNDGFKTAPQRNNEYTVTLPAGYNFKTDQNKTGLAQYGVSVTPDITANGKGQATVTVTQPPATVTDPTKKSTLKFKYSGFHEVNAPIVENMKVTVTGAKKPDGTAAPVINLPVTNENGFQVTLAAKGWEEVDSDWQKGQIEITNLTKKDSEPAGFEFEETYTGEAYAAEVKAAEDVEGLGTIKEIRYVKKDDQPTAEEVKTKATKDAPVDAGTYWVYCDVDAGTGYGAGEGLLAGKLTIASVNLTSLEEKDVAKYFKVDPEKVVFNGKNQKPEVTFADGITNAGKISDVKFYDEKGAEVNPKNVGKYTVKVKTEAVQTETTKNVQDTDNKYVTAGTFEITKTEPTADLYTMTPDSAVYDGLVKEPKITAKDGAGKVEDVHYYAEGDDTKEVEPIEAGKYTVKVDVAESDAYAAKKGLEIGTFTITKSASEQPTIYTVGHVENIGWGSDGKGKLEELKPGGTVDMGTTGRGLRVEAMAFIVPEDYKVIGFAHVENEGDVAVKEVKSSKDYEIPEGYVAYEFGSTGKGQRVEAVCVGLQDASGEYVKGFQYAVHLQNYGWQGFVRNGSFSGTRGMGLRMESVRFTYSEDDIVKAG